MSSDTDWVEDLKRYTEKRPFFREQSIWVIWVYRFGRRVDLMPAGFLKRLFLGFYHLLFKLTETVTGISIYKSVQIGAGLRIWHFGGIFIHHKAVIGKGCTLRQGVTIGNRTDDGLAPIIGNNVDFGAYAQVLGDVRVGDNCKIGAMTLVITDVPDGATAVGVPARIIPVKN